MPQRLFDEIDNWLEGINTSAPADKLTPGSSPRGRNTTLKSIGDSSALIGKRRGALTLNSTPITGAPGLWGFQFKKKSGTKYNLLVSTTGRLDQLNTDTTTTVLNAVAFTAGSSHIPIFAVANDLCFIVNDVDQKKFDGTNVQKFGIARPAAPSTGTAAAGGMAAGTWDACITYYNANTGHESSRSDFTSQVLSGAQKMTVTWSAPVDAQVTHVRVYIRQQTAGANAYRAIAGATPAPDATTGGYLPATLTTTLDITAVQYAAFTLLAPSTTENEPPAVGLKGPCWHQSRMFLFDSGNIYYSKIKDGVPYPEAFDPINFEPVDPNDGDTIVALASFNGKLYVFKKFSIYQLDGVDPNSWTISIVTPNFGCSAMRSIVFADGVMYWWGSNQGLCALSPGTAPVSLGKALIANTIAGTNLNESAYDLVCGGVDVSQETVLMSVPEFGSSTRNTLIIPFNYRRRRFAAEWWNPFDIISLWAVEDSTGLQTLYVGGYAGQTFQWWAAGNDGVPGATTTHGPVNPTVNPLTSTGTTLTDLSATFATAGGGLVERYVYAINSDRTVIQRRRITANTGTQLTVTPAWTANPNTTYTYVVGGIDFQIDTPWMVAPTPFFKKRFEFIFIEASSADLGVILDIDFFVSMDDSAAKKTRTLMLGGIGGLYDASTSVYDSTVFAGTSVTFGKKRIGTVGKTWKARIRNVQADNDVVLYRISVQGEVLGINR